MNIEIEFDNGELEIGQFSDLVYLVSKIGSAWKGVEYRLEELDGEKDTFVFIEDVLKEDEYECGIVRRKGKKAVAFSPAVHKMIMSAYEQYVQDFGAIN